MLVQSSAAQRTTSGTPWRSVAAVRLVPRPAPSGAQVPGPGSGVVRVARLPTRCGRPGAGEARPRPPRGAPGTAGSLLGVGCCLCFFTCVLGAGERVVVVVVLGVVLVDVVLVDVGGRGVAGVVAVEGGLLDLGQVVAP